MKTKIQIKTLGGSLLFEYESTNNTIRKTLVRAVEKRAYLRGADLRGADLRGADLTGADLRGADLRGADLRGADLTGADLTGAYLRGAYLRGADLTGAYLRGAYLTGAYLTGAYLKKIQSYFQIIPEEGSFIGWKSCANQCLVKLEIPSRAKRHNSLGGRKCRASYVKTLQIWDRNGNPIHECVGSQDDKTVYKVGRLTKPDKYDPDPLTECSNGIHFFITKQEAIDW